jgi:hypothetical protein
MSGFVFDAKAVRAAIAARGPKVAAVAVSAVLAAEGRAAARKPQEPQGASISAISTDPDEAEREERVAMAVARAPEPYLDAWARLQCQKLMRVSDDDWRQAIEAAGRFLDQWGNLAIEFQWTPADLFDVPRDGRPGGFVWWLAGETVRAFGPEHAVTEGERIFDRVTGAEWINPYQKGEHR